MKAVLFGAALAVHHERQAQIDIIQSTPGVLWTAAAHERFADDAPGASKTLCGVNIAENKAILESEIAAGRVKTQSTLLGAELGELPESFDSEENWPHCAKTIGDIRDQSNCGCCWAFGAAEAASDRMCIASKGALLMPLSAQDVCFCSSPDGCGGGDITSPWQYIADTGVVTGGQYQGTGPFGKGHCSDFSLAHCHHHGPQGEDPFPAEGTAGCPSYDSPQCPTSCDSEASGIHKSFSADKYTFDGEVISASGEQEIMEAISKGGPVEVAFTVYSDFENYAGGIYHHVSGESVGGHAVRLVGWGVENGTKYWKVANSWNPYWGEKGYFRIVKGTDESGIEDMVTMSSPDSKWSAAGQKQIVV